MVADVVAGHHGRLEPPRGNIDPGEPDDDFIGIAAGYGPGQQRDEIVAPRGIEQRLVGGDAGSDDPRDLAAEQPLGRLAIRRSWPVDLLADGHAAAGGHELHQLHVELMMGKAGHRQGVGPLFAAGEREVEEGGGLAGVVAEDLVEVAHAEEHQRPWAPCLRRLELLHHGCHG